MASNLTAMLAQLNSKPPISSAADPDKKKKPPAKPKAQSATKSKLKGGTPDGLPTGTKPSALSSRIGQASASGGGAGSSSGAATPSTTGISLTGSMNYSAPILDPTTAPLLKRQKDVLDALLARNGSRVTPAELLQITRLNLATDMQLLREVHRHERITWEGAPSTSEGKAATPVPAAPARWYAYLPEIAGIRDKVGLLNYVRDKGPAVLADQLRRCYLKAPEDLAELKKEGKIFIVGHTDPEKETVFVRDMMNQEGVQEDVRALWFEVCQEHVKDHVPADMHELQAAVNKSGLRSALANQPIKRTQLQGPRERQKKQRQQRINIDKATNAHLPFLFQANQPKNIDS